MYLCNSSSLTSARFVFLGMNHLRSNPILFSTCGFCQGLWGSAKKAGTPQDSWERFSMPRSKVTDFICTRSCIHSTADAISAGLRLGIFVPTMKLIFRSTATAMLALLPLVLGDTSVSPSKCRYLVLLVAPRKRSSMLTALEIMTRLLGSCFLGFLRCRFVQRCLAYALP